MKKESNRAVKKLCLWAGIGLLAVAAVMLIGWQWGIRTSQKKAGVYVDTIRALTPQPQSAALEPRRDNTMSVLSIDGTNFVGILEMPQHGATLPVCANWGNVSKYPCRLDGSVYDGTIQIGGTSQKGQYDFYREISVGDSVFFTDMEGNRFAYTITDIQYEKHADQTALQQKDVSLVLFIKNIYAFEYIVLFCDVTG